MSQNFQGVWPGFFFGLCLSVISTGTFAQLTDKEMLPERSLPDEISLPPLQAVIDSALVHSPLIQFWETESEIQDQEIRQTRKSWAGRIDIQADVRYGTIDNILVNQSGITTSDIYQSSQSMRYNAGMALKLPISEVLSKSHANKIEKLKYEQVLFKLEETRQDIRNQAIMQYNHTLLRGQLLRISGENMQNWYVQAKTAELDFKNGNIEITEYGRINENYLKSQVDYETAKEQFNTALALLQELTGITSLNPGL